VCNSARSFSLFSSSHIVRSFFGREDFFFKHSKPVLVEAVNRSAGGPF
jgi:hypothetical protein